MVTFYVVSEYIPTKPIEGDGKKILGGPLYDLARIKAITQGGKGLLLWTRDCVRDVQELGWSHDDVIQLIQGLRHDEYIDSEWCSNGRDAWAACDAYATHRVERIESINKSIRIEYFVKLAINKLGTMVMTISCHTS